MIFDHVIGEMAKRESIAISKIQPIQDYIKNSLKIIQITKLSKLIRHMGNYSVNDIPLKIKTRNLINIILIRSHPRKENNREMQVFSKLFLQPKPFFFHKIQTINPLISTQVTNPKKIKLEQIKENKKISLPRCALLVIPNYHPHCVVLNASKSGADTVENAAKMKPKGKSASSNRRRSFFERVDRKMKEASREARRARDEREERNCGSGCPSVNWTLPVNRDRSLLRGSTQQRPTRLATISSSRSSNTHWRLPAVYAPFHRRGRCIIHALLLPLLRLLAASLATEVRFGPRWKNRIDRKTPWLGF